MRRREFLRSTALATAGALWGAKAAAKTKPRPDRLNVLVIMTDQQHAGMMSCEGNPWLKTPAMDAVAASGVRFERAYATNPVCMPSRFSLQTGRMPSAIGLEWNRDDPMPGLTADMRDQSLGQLFSRAGYETVFGGKVHLPHGMTDIRELGYRNLTVDCRQGLADACAGFLREKHDRPFLLFASFINPHDICYMAINAYERAQGKAPVANLDSTTLESVLDHVRNSGDLKEFVEKNCPPLPANYEIPGLEPECITQKFTQARPFRAYVREHWSDLDWRLHRWAYCRLTEKVDAEIGAVMQALRDAGLEDDTLVVFTSDHGDMDSAHRLEHKSVLYEESVHIPLVLSHKDAIPAGKLDAAHLVSNGLDLLPTLCDYIGIKAPEGLPGRSLRPLLNGTVPAWRDFVAIETQNGRMLRTDQFKYCIYDSGQHREQLMDMKNDPGEMQNLAESENAKNVLDEHRKRLREWEASVGDSIAAQYMA